MRACEDTRSSSTRLTWVCPIWNERADQKGTMMWLTFCFIHMKKQIEIWSSECKTWEISSRSFFTFEFNKLNSHDKTSSLNYLVWIKSTPRDFLLSVPQRQTYTLNSMHALWHTSVTHIFSRGIFVTCILKPIVFRTFRNWKYTHIQVGTQVIILISYSLSRPRFKLTLPLSSTKI